MVEQHPPRCLQRLDLNETQTHQEAKSKKRYLLCYHSLVGSLVWLFGCVFVVRMLVVVVLQKQTR